MVGRAGRLVDDSAVGYLVDQANAPLKQVSDNVARFDAMHHQAGDGRLLALVIASIVGVDLQFRRIGLCVIADQAVRAAAHFGMGEVAGFRVKDGLPEDAGKTAEDDLQKIHDKYIKQVDDLFVDKEKEILTV